MQTLFLMRHGQSEANRLRIVAGRQESPLSTLGESQAATSAEGIKNLGIDLIVCSPQVRARQTADIVAKIIGYNPNQIVTIEELQERDLGELEGKNYADSPSHNGNAEDVANIPGVESDDDLYARAKKALEIIERTPGSRVLIVCHNGLGRMISTIRQGLPAPKLYEQPRLENAKTYQLP